MSQVRRLVLTADDFGLSAEVNDAVAELAAAKQISATSLLVRAGHAEAALDLKVSIAVGLHVQLDLAEFAHATSAQVEALIEDQVCWMLERGTAPTHLDLHTAALYGLGPQAPRPGGVVAEALAVAAAHGLPLRLPRALPAGTGVTFSDSHAALVARADALGVALPQMILTDSRDAGQITGPDDALEHYLRLLEQVPAGCSELFTHPARPAGTPADAMARKRGWEYELLRSGALQHRAAAHSIEICSGPITG